MLPSGNDAAYCLAEFFGKCLLFEATELQNNNNKLSK